MKIGKYVVVYFSLSLLAIDENGVGNISIAGLPFSRASGHTGSVQYSQVNHITIPDGCIPSGVVGYPALNEIQIRATSIKGGADTILSLSNLANNSTISGSASYLIG